MRKSILMITSLLMLSACGGKKTQAGIADLAVGDSAKVEAKADSVGKTAGEEQDMEAVKAFVEQFYKDWDKRDLLDYDYMKQFITPNLLKYLADSYEFECEGECLATWKFFYEGGIDISGMKSRLITPRDANHVLVENKYENYEYDILLMVIKDADTFKIDSIQQVKSVYLD